MLSFSNIIFNFRIRQNSLSNWCHIGDTLYINEFQLLFHTCTMSLINESELFFFFNEILHTEYFILLLTNISDRQSVNWRWGNRIDFQIDRSKFSEDNEDAICGRETERRKSSKKSRGPFLLERKRWLLTVKPLPPSVLGRFSVDGIPDRRHRLCSPKIPFKKFGIGFVKSFFSRSGFYNIAFILEISFFATEDC